MKDLHELAPACSNFDLVGGLLTCTACDVMPHVSYLHKGWCYDNCRQFTGFAEVPSEHKCEPCSVLIEGCLECIHQVGKEHECTKCEEGLLLEDGKCVKQCSRGWF